MPTIEQARDWYTSSDSVHDFEHVMRVYHLAERICQAEGADLEIVRAAVLLHDIHVPTRKEEGSGQPEKGTHLNEASSRQRTRHHFQAALFARQVLAEEGWSEERISAVEHTIRAHRFRDDSEQPETLEAKILFDADKLDAIGAIGAARAIAYAVQASQPIYTQPSDQFIKYGKPLAGESHSAYHEYIFKLSKLKERLFTPTAKSIARERHDFMAKYFQRLRDEISGAL